MQKLKNNKSRPKFTGCNEKKACVYICSSFWAFLYPHVLIKQSSYIEMRVNNVFGEDSGFVTLSTE